MSDGSIDWPHGYDRTPADDRETAPFDTDLTRKAAFVSIEEELGYWGKTDVRIDTAATHCANYPNRPHQHDTPDDPGVVAYFRAVDESAHERSAIACDRWTTLRDNARAISLWVRRIRLAARCGVATARDVDEVAQLPPGNPDAVSAPVAAQAGATREWARMMLEVGENASRDVINAAYRTKMKEAHPDRGGSNDRTISLNKARAVMLDE